MHARTNVTKQPKPLAQTAAVPDTPYTDTPCPTLAHLDDFPRPEQNSPQLSLVVAVNQPEAGAGDAGEKEDDTRLTGRQKGADRGEKGDRERERERERERAHMRTHARTHIRTHARTHARLSSRNCVCVCMCDEVT